MTKELILKTVCDVLNVEIRDVLQSNDVPGARKTELVQARNLFMYFAFIRYRLGTQYSVSKYVNRDHSTLINALTSVRNDNETDSVRLAVFIKVKKRLGSIEIDIQCELESQETGFDYQEISDESLSYQTNKAL